MTTKWIYSISQNENTIYFHGCGEESAQDRLLLKCYCCKNEKLVSSSYLQAVSVSSPKVLDVLARVIVSVHHSIMILSSESVYLSLPPLHPQSKHNFQKKPTTPPIH